MAYRMKIFENNDSIILRKLVEAYGYGGVVAMLAGLQEPVEGWSPLVRAQHDATVAIPAWLLSMPPGDRQEFADWLVAVAKETAKDPEATAYSIG